MTKLPKRLKPNGKSSFKGKDRRNCKNKKVHGCEKQPEYKLQLRVKEIGADYYEPIQTNINIQLC